MSDLPTFIYLIRPKRPSFPKNMTEEEDRLIDEHFAYLQRLLAEGRLVIAGPCDDAAFGLVIFHAATPEEARDVMANDPAVVGGLMTAELHRFNIALLQ